MLEVDVALAGNFLIALLIGALVGIEREKRKSACARPTFGGIRTFILLAQIGAVSAWMAQRLAQPWLFVTALVAVASVVLTAYVLEGRRNSDNVGLTTEIAALTVFLLGGAVMVGYAEIAVPLAILTSAVLAFKQPLHGLIAKIGEDDLYAGLKLLIASFIVLPLLPNYYIDPWNALNPYKLWLLVVLISALSLVGYTAMRWLGSAHGTAVTGLAGGLVSSTAVTLGLARQSTTETGTRMSDALAAGVLLAWTVMFVRVLIAVGIVFPSLLAALLVPFVAMALAGGGFAIFYYRRGIAEQQRREGEKSNIALRNPFSLTAATQFALLFAVVLLVVKLTELYLPQSGLYMVAALAGLTDVDAITLSMAQYAERSRDFSTAAGAIAIAAISNTLVKCGFIVALGDKGLRTRILLGTGAILVTGAAAVPFI